MWFDDIDYITAIYSKKDDNHHKNCQTLMGEGTMFAPSVLSPPSPLNKVPTALYSTVPPRGSKKIGDENTG